ncbi:hypothetical protein ACF1GT_18295 [Streptomyces sp. NPDC014636]|uniref:hypothetical protein n=1 Tax=Streptomyces sp. NPDC014636 TaxID=3364876 RepID=UPI0036F713AD
MNGFVVAIGCLVGYLVYRKPLLGAGVDCQPSGGDLASGIGAALAAVLILAFLLGVGDDKSAGTQDGGRKPTPVASEETVRPSSDAPSEPASTKDRRQEGRAVASPSSDATARRSLSPPWFRRRVGRQRETSPGASGASALGGAPVAPEHEQMSAEHRPPRAPGQ